MKILSVSCALVMLAVALPAAAQPVMTASTPAAGATAARLSRITLSFETPLMPGMAGAQIVMTGMPGMADHPPMIIKAFTTALSEDGKTLTLALRKPLPEGSYTVRWSATGADKTKATGAIDFSAK